MENISEVHTLKMPELKELVRRYGLKKTSKLTKAQLVNVLMEHLESIVADPAEPIKPEEVLELPVQDLEEAVAELSVESDETPPESPPKKTRKPRKRKTISDSD
jgi:histone H3/H4